MEIFIEKIVISVHMLKEDSSKKNLVLVSLENASPLSVLTKIQEIPFLSSNSSRFKSSGCSFSIPQ